MTINHFSTATQMLDALARKEVSSAELTEMQIQRIEACDDTLNAIPIKTFDRAREEAQAADKRIALGEQAPLLGLPMTLKESTHVAGLPQTAGLEIFKGYLPETDGMNASRTFNAGPALLGKTNIPIALGDWQADSPVYGRCVNPWDTTRTPGGSTGGGGAALASGMTPLELGSDIGGSIRVPAAYCGVYGHRPSETAIPRSGAFPMADVPNASFLFGVQGPLARSAQDLELYFDVLSGAETGEDVAWRLDFPAPRHNDLKGFRVGVMTSVMEISASKAMLGRIEELSTFLRSEGCSVDQVEPPFDIQEFMVNYIKLLNLFTSMGMPEEERMEAANEMRKSDNFVQQAIAEGYTMSANEFLINVAMREVFKAAWSSFFEKYDVIVCPTVPDVAFTHQEGSMIDRTLQIDNQTIPYYYNIFFPALAIYTGLPATAFPAGLSDDGLPLGFQAIGPYLEDKTTLKFAQLLEERWQGFTPPPDYS